MNSQCKRACDALHNQGIFAFCFIAVQHFNGGDEVLAVTPADDPAADDDVFTSATAAATPTINATTILTVGRMLSVTLNFHVNAKRAGKVTTVKPPFVIGIALPWEKTGSA